MLFAVSQWENVTMRLCLMLLLLLVLLMLMPDVLRQQQQLKGGRLIICTFCCKDLLSFYADKRFTHIKSGVNFISIFKLKSVSGLLFLSQLCRCVLCLWTWMWMWMWSECRYSCECVAYSDTLGMQWNEVISVADLVIYHYSLMMPACDTIFIVLLPVWVMATIWHWHSCINQLTK